MFCISDFQKKYSKKLDFLDFELLIAAAIRKPREFVLAHPEQKLTQYQVSSIKYKVSERIKGKPLAYILGHKEFYGLDFNVNKHTLIPRPETELLVEQALRELKTKNQKPKTIIDIGTGSGNIIISLAKNNEQRARNNIKYFATDISKFALQIAKQNAKKHNVAKKINFFHGNLLEPILKHATCDMRHAIILANLPYLSKEIYQSAPTDVRKYEPKTALYSPEAGLAHYHKLLLQIKKLVVTGYGLRVTGFFEISPEQKPTIQKLIKSYFPEAKIGFQRDLAGKWRLCQFEL